MIVEELDPFPNCNNTRLRGVSTIYAPSQLSGFSNHWACNEVTCHWSRTNESPAWCTHNYTHHPNWWDNNQMPTHDDVINKWHHHANQQSTETITNNIWLHGTETEWYDRCKQTLQVQQQQTQAQARRIRLLITIIHISYMGSYFDRVFTYMVSRVSHSPQQKNNA